MDSNLAMRGSVMARKMACPKAPLSWRVRNTLRLTFLLGWFFNLLAKAFSKLTGIPTLTANLAIKLLRADGTVQDYGVVSHRLVTDAAVAYIVDDIDNASGGADISLWNYHGCGTTNTAESVSDTALLAESTTALNPDSTRATGTRSQPTANQFRSVGTLTFDNTAAVVEHGIFTTSGTGTGVLLDRSVFTVINVGAGDSIQFTYTISINSGG